MSDGENEMCKQFSLKQEQKSYDFYPLIYLCYHWSIQNCTTQLKKNARHLARGLKQFPQAFS
jgi:hypothetical protein